MKEDLEKQEINVALSKHFSVIRNYYLNGEIYVEQEILRRKNEKKKPTKQIRGKRISDSEL